MPTVQVIAPQNGDIHRASSSVDVIALVTDGEGVGSVNLIWTYNAETYPCPSDGQFVDCVVNGDEYRWTVSLGRVADRPFQIRARNTRGRTTTTPERTIHVRDSLDAIAPTVRIVDPTPDAQWRVNSTVLVTAEITDDEAVDEVHLLWDYNDNEYPCPHESRYVDCAVDGDRYTWSVRVGTGSRTFTVRAVDEAGNATTSPDRRLDLVNN